MIVWTYLQQTQTKFICRFQNPDLKNIPEDRSDRSSKPPPFIDRIRGWVLPVLLCCLEMYVKRLVG